MLVAVNGVDLHVEVSGEGDPLLWVHGFFGTGSDWRHVFGDPPPGFRMVGPDLRGHGRSTPPAGAFSFRQAADDLWRLLDHLGFERVRAIGLSGGGLALLHLATAAPGRIESMVLVSAPPRFPEQAKAIQRGASEAMFGEAGMARLREVHAGGEPQVRGLLAWARALADSGDDVDFTEERLAAITADTLVVFGDRDPLYPVSLAFELHAGIPRSWLWVVPNGGHGPIFGRDAPAFARTALAFLRRDWRS